MKPIVIIGIALIVVLIPSAIFGYLSLIPMAGKAISTLDPDFNECKKLSNESKQLVDKSSEQLEIAKTIDTNTEFERWLQVMDDSQQFLFDANEKIIEMEKLDCDRWD
jgi:hypothetical protein